MLSALTETGRRKTRQDVVSTQPRPPNLHSETPSDSLPSFIHLPNACPTKLPGDQGQDQKHLPREKLEAVVWLEVRHSGNANISLQWFLAFLPLPPSRVQEARLSYKHSLPLKGVQGRVQSKERSPLLAVKFPETTPSGPWGAPWFSQRVG